VWRSSVPAKTRSGGKRCNALHLHTRTADCERERRTHLWEYGNTPQDLAGEKTINLAIFSMEQLEVVTD
jgi:hypothetical protein